MAKWRKFKQEAKIWLMVVAILAVTLAAILADVADKLGRIYFWWIH